MGDLNPSLQLTEADFSALQVEHIEQHTPQGLEDDKVADLEEDLKSNEIKILPTFHITFGAAAATPARPGTVPSKHWSLHRPKRTQVLNLMCHDS